LGLSECSSAKYVLHLVAGEEHRTRPY